MTEQLYNSACLAIVPTFTPELFQPRPLGLAPNFDQFGVRLEKVPEVALSELEALAQAHPDDNDLAAVLACANLMPAPLILNSGAGDRPSGCHRDGVLL